MNSNLPATHSAFSRRSGVTSAFRSSSRFAPLRALVATARHAALGIAGLAVAGCASHPTLQQSAGAAAPGPLREGPSERAMAAAWPVPQTPPRDSRAEAPPALPDQIVLPASYRFMILDGHLALVRQTDMETLQGGPASLRIVTGEIARGELAYQPGLLPQELAAEVASSRSAVARMEEALASVMQRSRELAARAEALDARNREMQELIAALRARLGEKPSPRGAPETVP